MAKMGVAHQPGLAADLMRQLAPLLKEDGIDLDDLGNTDRDQLSAALDRATERHNLALFTPVGRYRELSLAVLRSFVTAVSDGDQPLARAVLNSVPRDETAQMPAGSHVIGATAGLLDTLLSDRAFSAVRPRMRVPAWTDRAATLAARDIVPLASAGRAFDALDSVIARHGGKAVMDGAALALAAALIAEADVRGTSVAQVVARVLPGDVEIPAAAGGADATASGQSFRRAKPRQMTDAVLLSEFEAWMRRQPEVTPATAEESRELLIILLEIADEAGLDVRDPRHVDSLIDEVYEAFTDAPTQVLDRFLVLIDDHVHFQLALGHDREAWEQAHAEIEDELESDADDDAGELLQEAMARGAEVDDEVQRAALLQLPMISAVPALLEWLGESRAVTPSGALRRADIAEVAALIGIDAVGVAKRSAQSSDAPQQVTSMRELSVLTAWWEALQLSDVIELTSTRVRPGGAASEWSSGAEPTREAAEVLASGVAVQILGDNDLYLDGDQRILTSTVVRLMEALSADGMPAPDIFADDPFTYLSGRRVVMLQQVGLVESPQADVFAVPDALLGTMTRAVLLLMALQIGLPSDGDGPDEW